MKRQQEILIYTDGGCKGNPGPGGWAYVLIFNDEVIKDKGAQPQTTNNKMELRAVIESLKKCNQLDPDYQIKLTVVTDSQYVKNGISSWIHGWKRNGWKTAAKKAVKNQEYWMALDGLVEKREVQWRWVKGHSGDPMNELCDEMVGQAIGGMRQDLLN